MKIEMNGTLLELLDGDLTELDVEAIVNAANEKLQLGGGVAGAIRDKGGPSIQKECDRIGGTAVGTAVITGAGNLSAKHVIHAVGPKMGEGDEDRKLSSAVRSSLALADRHGLRSVALPAISTGSFGFPMDRCARITLTEIHRYLQGGTKLERVVVCLHGEKPFNTFRTELRRGFR
ncbi:MAG: macro domain-containing protein [Thermoanaerobaculia bacterium]|nr:macro domain-containing protein [Thermoanaerobaculia bacterium]